MITEFNIQEAKNGADVRTKSGRKVRILCTDAKSYDREDIVALVESENGKSENILRYYSDGRLISDSSDSGDRNKDLIIYIPDPEPQTKKELVNRCVETITRKLELEEGKNYPEIPVDRNILKSVKELLQDSIFSVEWEDYKTDLWNVEKSRFIISGNTLFDTARKKCLSLLKLTRDEE